jgi:hypothetical protein
MGFQMVGFYIDDLSCLFVLSCDSDNVIDCRCEGGRFLVSTSCVTISNHDSLSSSERSVNPGLRS